MVNLSPIGIDGTALVDNQLSICVDYRERLCRNYCPFFPTPPQTVITYTYDTPVLNGTTLFIPITAAISVTCAGCNGCATTKMYSENFMVAFQGQTAVPTTVTIESLGKNEKVVTDGYGSFVEVCDSLTINIG